MTARVWTRGRAVVDHVLQYVSPSQIVSGDHESYGGCLRRFYYRRVEGREEPQGKAAAEGVQGHGEIETYLKTGKMVLGQSALAAKRFLPEPSPELLLELPIDDGTLLAAGVPVVGFIDYLNVSRVGRLDHADVADPSGSAEIVDWKFTGRREFPTAHEVASAVPMNVYGEWAARKYGLEWVRLSHVYISTRRREATKRSLLVPREEIQKKWLRAEAVVRRLQQAASSKCADEVDANLDACTAYGGCPHRAVCKAGEQRTLVDLLGPLGAASLLQEEKPAMSLLNIPALAALKAAAPDVAAAKADLLKEERAASVSPETRAAVDAIRAKGYGQPTLNGAAAQAWAAAIGVDFTGTHLPGTGPLAQTTVEKVEDLAGIAKELEGYPQGPEAVAPVSRPAPLQAPQALGLLPPDAPKSDPVKALAALEGKPAPVEVVVQTAAVKAAESSLDQFAMLQAGTHPRQVAELAQDAKAIANLSGSVVTLAPDAHTPITDRVAEKEDAGEMKLSKKARAYVEGLLAKIADLEGRPASVPVAEVTVHTHVAAPTARVEVYVDAIPPSPGYVDLASWVHAQAARLAKLVNAADVRCAPQESALGFGKWKGALAALIRDAKEAPLEPGAYFLDTRGSEIAEIAAEALRSRGQVTRGIR